MKEATAKRREPEDVEMKEEEPAAGSSTGEGGKKELDSVTLEGIYLSSCCVSYSYRLCVSVVGLHVLGVNARACCDL